jgi:rhamnulokinase
MIGVSWLRTKDQGRMEKKLLAFDLGAESGRGVLGLFDGRRLRLEVVHRFPNGPVRTLDTLHWDVLHLYTEMLAALRRCAAEHGGLDSLGVDTWGVDFALLGRGGTLLGNPRHYRDPHTEGVMEAAFARVPRAEVFRRTGLQFMRFNTLFQLLALQRDRSPLLDVAENLLFMPDLFHYFFTGMKVNEFTDASTSQLYDPTARGWAFDLVRAFGLPERILGSIVPPGTVLGPLRALVATETGLQPVPVVAPASHDTGSAVAAVPASGESWAYISSGTWSLMGAELPAPLINEQVQRYNFTNEGGVGGTIRFLKNVMGLWLVQECRRVWERAGRSYTYADLIRLAEAAPPFVSLVDPDDAGFILPASMPAALAESCRRTGQPEPAEPGAVIRCALESLALRYRWVLERLEELLGRRLDVIHVVGGGCQNALLCQFTAGACNRPVLAGPVEATAIGNVLVQAIGLRLLGSLAEARDVVRQSFEVVRYEPRNAADWQGPYERFLRFLG